MEWTNKIIQNPLVSSVIHFTVECKFVQAKSVLSYETRNLHSPRYHGLLLALFYFWFVGRDPLNTLFWPRLFYSTPWKTPYSTFLYLSLTLSHQDLATRTKTSEICINLLRYLQWPTQVLVAHFDAQGTSIDRDEAWLSVCGWVQCGFMAQKERQFRRFSPDHS